MIKTFFFYDLETSGLNPREDRIMQFAGQRTDLKLRPVGEPVNILVKLSDDALPSPSAVMVTKITPQATLRDGISEAEFCKYVTEEIFTPGTIAVGYNTIRFDDEFMRATLWRNFYDPYEWEWKDERSRWDILDAVRLTRALRPEGIKWPFNEKGAPTNRLELITKLNGVSHEHAHDALSDVFATIAVAHLIYEKQPKLFEYLFKMRSKNEVKRLVNLEHKRPFVYASGRYASEFNKTTVAFPLTSGRNGNVLVFDLRYNLERVLAEKEAGAGAEVEAEAETKTEAEPGFPACPSGSSSHAALAKSLYLAGHLGNPGLASASVSTPSLGPASASASVSFYPIVKELCFNKCPAVAPITVLDSDGGWEKIGLSRETVEKNLQTLLSQPEFAERMREKHENRPEFPPAQEPEAALYDGFLNEPDRVRVAAVRNAEPERLADFHPEFIDERLPELLLHYKGRNFPQTLSESETRAWQEFRQARLSRLAPKFLKELEENYDRDDFVAEELKLYFESLFDSEY